MKKNQFLKESDVTAESVFFMKRRQVLKALGISAAALSLPHAAHADLLSWFKGNDRPPAPAGKPLEFSKPAAWQNNLPLTPVDKVSGYNNFYEFGLDKADPAANAGSLKTDPWTLKISGEVAKPLTLDHDDLTRRFPLEERIYRMRCVEAWSMVVPWIGFPLHKLLALAEPTSNAKYVAFETIYAPEQMPGQQDRFIGGGLKYPYVEGLRLDEAMHPLTLMTVGVYGKALPPQNGAPVRLIVPWKYGFKGIKSIVSIKLTRERPPTTWNLAAPDEYGFYANVNPHVDHPRWSQATERFIGSGGILDVQRQPTLLFNGYADQVASLYRGLDASDSKTGDMAESLPASCRIVAVSLAGLGDQSRWTGCRSGERYSAFYRSHCTEVFAGDLVNHTSGTLRKTAVIDTHSPPVRLMVLCLGDTAFNQLRIAGAGRE